MGNFLSSVWTKLLGHDDVRILMVGLDNAGKTTILYQLKFGKVISSVPTIGFNVETVAYKNIFFTVWDIGGQDKIRNLWRVYFQGSGGIIFVIDSSDRKRMSIMFFYSFIHTNSNAHTLTILLPIVCSCSCFPALAGHVSVNTIMSEVKRELWRLLEEDELENVHLLIFANKQDVESAMSTTEIREQLGLNDLKKRSWFVLSYNFALDT